MLTALRYTLYGLFAVSGFCGLIYESIWSHYLRNYLGHAAHGQTVVLVIFVGGLALGAWLAGRYTGRLREPLLAYAATEILIGLFAFAFHPLFVGFTGWAYDALLPAVCGTSSWCTTQWLTAALMIVLPATALGATFPWMVAGVLRRYPHAPGHEISVLYFLNSLGAVVGVLASAFVFIPAFGLPGTVMLAGALNVAIGVAIAALAWHKPPAPVETVTVPPVVDEPAPRKVRKRKAIAPAATVRAASDSAPPRSATPASLTVTLLAVAALTGMASFIYEIVWLRMLAMVLGASTHAFELMLAAFILGLAAGGAWIRNRIDGIVDATSFLGHVQVWMAVAAVATLPLYGHLFDGLAYLLSALARNDPGYSLFRVGSAVIALVVMLPATFLAGMTLPLITFRLLAAGAGERAIGSVYAANTIGAILGVVAAVHVLMPLAGLKGALLAGAAIDMLLGVYLLWRPPGEQAFSWRGFATVIAGVAVFGLIATVVQPDARRMASGVYREGSPRLADSVKMLYHADGKTATVNVIETADQRLLITNGKTDASIALPGHPPTSDEPTQVLLGALAIAANPKAKRAAVIGMGSGITSATLLAWPSIERVDTIEIEPRMVDGARLLSERNATVFSDARSHIVYDDAKARLARAEGPWDIVVSEPSNPWVSGVASLFTSETYARMAKHLAPGGVFVQWIHLYEMDGTLLSSILRALVSHFPHYEVYAANTGDLIVVAARERRPVVDSSILFARHDMASLLRAGGVATAPDVQGRWRGSDTTVNAMMAAFDAPANSDYRPFVDVHAERARFRRSDVSLFQAPIAAPVPMDLLGAARPDDERGTALAMALAEALTAAPEVAVTLPPTHAAHEGVIRASRELLRTCRHGGPPAVLLEGAIGTAIIINDNLDKSRAVQVWATVRDGPCYRAMAPEVQRWVDLFAAVAARDAGAMAELGTRLVASAPHAFALDYALAAAVVGEIARGNPDAGTQLIMQYATAQSAVWMFALREMAARRTIGNPTR
jgi:spermidine synthase